MWTLSLIVTMLMLVGCGETATRVQANNARPTEVVSSLTPQGSFRIVDREYVYLNGRENEGRPPMVQLLVGSTIRSETPSEDDLSARYAQALDDDGWHVDPYETEEDWWVFYGWRGNHSVRIGPATRFDDLATADEGYARTKFSQFLDDFEDPLIVVSLDPNV